MPKPLQEMVVQKPANNVTVQLPLSFVMPQLARGLVQVAFGDLKQLSPAGVFSPSPRFDQEWVTVPLQSILQQLPPEALTRRKDQKTITVPDEIIVLFGGPQSSAKIGKKRGAPVSPVVANPRPAAEAPPAPRVTPAPVVPPQPSPVSPLPTPSSYSSQIPVEPPVSAQRLPEPTISSHSVTAQPPTGLPPSAPESLPVQPDSGPIRLTPILQNQLQSAEPPTPPAAPAAPIRMSSTFGLDTKAPPHPGTAPGLAGKTAPLPGPLKGGSPLPLTPSIPIAPLPASARPVVPPGAPSKGTLPGTSSSGFPPRASEPSAPSIPVPQPFTPASPLPAAVPAPVKPEGTPTALPASPQESGALAAALTAVSASWPDAIRQELTQLRLEQASLHVPIEEVEQNMKQGRLAYPWKKIRSWIRPALSSAIASLHDDKALQLPLAIFIPLLMSQKKLERTGRMLPVPEIPDLFTGPSQRPPAAHPEAAAPAASALAPTVVPSPIPVRPPPSPTPVEPPPISAISDKEIPDVGELFGQPGKLHWTPAEITQKTASLPGVAGALIAMQDGLLVASQLPTHLNGEMIAAFLPQMFGRMSHYTAELKLGEPTSFLVVVNRMPLQINRVGRIFYTVLGKPGESLPGPAIASIVAQLDRQSKQI
ncbi:MAG TPA: hypothetical protein P5186_21525 [Candidatus Paceibacterota bacterium]|nr:hypothetical protein [Verrucomicrobiota bacterium]HRY50640.1 hypothetical protein [Candidatus Paceibacterota bacterium]